MPTLLASLLLLAAGAPPLAAQTLFNIDFGVGSASGKTGFAATGLSTNDYWNLYNLYGARFIPGTQLRPNGRLEKVKLWDQTESPLAIAVTNAPGVWGNASGDKMFDSYLFAMNGSNLTITVTGLLPGRYHFYCYGHADPDATGEQNSLFTIHSGTNTFGPLTSSGATGWKATLPWQENQQFVVFRDVPVFGNQPVIIAAAPGPNGVAVINGLQILSRGTAPPRLPLAVADKAAAAYTNLIFREVRYDGKVSDTEARFNVSLSVESLTTNEISAPLFDGEVAVIAPTLPDGLRLVSGARQFHLIATKPGNYDFKLDVVAKITRAEPWNQISFAGPAAAISSLQAQAGSGVELQLLSGAPDVETARRTNATHVVSGFLGADRTLSLRWQSKAAEITRKSLVTVDTLASAQISPTVVKYTTKLRYEILQAPLSRLYVALPLAQTLTRLEGAQIRDWSVKGTAQRGKPIEALPVKVPAGHALLAIEFIKPVEKAYELTLFSEQAVETTPVTAALQPPQPLEIDRESGSFTLAADETVVETDSVTGLRQVNAPIGSLAAFRFYGRPISLAARLKRIEPVINSADRVAVRLEETRQVIVHTLSLSVEKAGIYALELTPQSSFTVADVRGEGVEDWKADGGKLRINFAARVLGARNLVVQLEQPHKQAPQQITVAPLRIAGATKENAQVGAASAPGIRLKTAEMNGLREIPVTALGARSDEALAYTDLQPDWSLSLSAERLPPRVVAEVFNLITVGDGLIGGSATVRYGIINQGVQAFRVRLPAHWKNVEFTGPNIRRKEASPQPPQGETNSVIWTITLQDKMWGGYTLVITYDYQFNPKQATLDTRGAHVLDVERETGSVAITTAASLKLEPKPAVAPLRVIDPTELAETDRALVTRPVLLAYRYEGGDFQLGVNVTRHAEVQVLDAVADRTQITTVLTEAGEMLTQASFMVKNNEKQFQKFELPGDAQLWSCYVNNEPVKAEKDGKWTLVSLPRTANRDQAFAVDIVYAQQVGKLEGWLGKKVELVAPRTDVPNTYAEWQLYVPTSRRLSGFGGNMTVAQGTEYGLREAWQEFVAFYSKLIEDAGLGITVTATMILLLTALFARARKSGMRGVVEVVVVFGILMVLAGMLLPALAKAKARSQSIKAISNLKQIGLAARIYANEHGERLPNSFEEMSNELQSEMVLIDPGTGSRFTYVGAGKQEGDPNAIIAYSPARENGRREVALADGSVQQMTAEKFAEALARDAISVAQSRVAGKPSSVSMPAATPPPPPMAAMPALQPAKPAEAGRMLAETESFGRRADQLADGDKGIERRKANEEFVPAEKMMKPKSLTDIPGRRSDLAGGAGGGGFQSINATGTMLAIAPTAAGIRSIRIDIPKSGLQFNFTKVLNIGGEPLSVRASVMERKTFNRLRMVGQLAAFLAGLFLVWQQWHRPHASGLRLALGLALALGASANLGIAGRVLHLTLIAAAALIALLLFIWIVHKLWKSGQSVVFHEEKAAPASGPGGLPPAATAIALLLGLQMLGAPSSAQAANLESQIVNRKSQITNAVSITSATYTGLVTEKVAQFDAVIQLTSVTTNQAIALFGDDVAIQQFTAKTGEAKLVREGNAVGVLLPNRGGVTLQFKLVAKLGGEVSKRTLAFGIPPAFSSQFTATLDEAGADVEFPTAVAFKRTTEGQQTRVEAIIGATGRFEMQWTPRVKRVAEMETTVFCQSAALVTFGGGVVNTRATLEYQIAQGELRQLQVRLPEGQRLLRVEGEWMRTWELKTEGGSQVLFVDLVKGVTPNYRLTVETEKSLDKLPARTRVEVPHALEVKREAGLIAVRGGEELSLGIENAQELQRVDAAEFARVSKEKADGITSAWRYLKTGFQLTVKAEAVQPRLEVVSLNNLRIGFEQTTLSAQLEYTVKQAGIFSVKLALPAGYRLETLTGPNVKQWVEDKPSRTVEVTFKERTTGTFTLQAQLVSVATGLAPAMELAGVHPLDVQKLTGYVGVSAEAGVSVKTTTFDGLTEIPASTVVFGRGTQAGSAGIGVGGLAFRFIAADPVPASQPWKLTVATETVESWVRAEVVNLVTLSETLVSGRALVRYDIQNAPVKEFRLRVPEAYTNVDITGTNIRRRDQNGEEWRVELQNKVSGIVMLTVTWEQPRAVGTNFIGIAGVQALNVERETGAVSLLAKPPLQVVEKKLSGELLKVDARELPDWAGVNAAAGRNAEVPVLSYRYLRPGWQLAAEVKRFDDAALLQALVDSVRLTTVVADDGQVMTEMALQVRNNGRQHLEVQLPPKAKVWSAFVNGQPVRPNQRGDILLLPLEQSGAAEAAIPVELTFVGEERFPRTKGEVALMSPKLDVPLKNAQWDLWLPPDYDYAKFGGTMRHEAAAAPVSQTYSLAEYGLQEVTRGKARASKVSGWLSSARSNLAAGNVKEVDEVLKQARANTAADDAALKDVQQLEEQLNRTRGSNLIKAQRDYTIDNYYKSAHGAQPQAQAGQQAQQMRAIDYDADVAQRQWGMLQKAQELTVTRVQPLRVNLPTRGLRHSFTQVLQTEVNKPMTVSLVASNTKVASWPRRIGASFGGFVLLWILAGVLLDRRKEVR